MITLNDRFVFRAAVQERLGYIRGHLEKGNMDNENMHNYFLATKDMLRRFGDYGLGALEGDLDTLAAEFYGRNPQRKSKAAVA